MFEFPQYTIDIYIYMPEIGHINFFEISLTHFQMRSISLITKTVTGRVPVQLRDCPVTFRTSDAQALIPELLLH